MITCIFGLTACGSEEELTAYEQQKVTYAEQYATQQIVPFFAQFMNDSMTGAFDDYTWEEIEYIISTEQGLQIKGTSVSSAIESFNSAADEIGEIVAITGTSSKIDDKQIIVNVDIDGTVKDAQAEIIFTNDMFMVVESASLNPIASIGDLMTKAALNTVIGMGTVFVVLILICGIISCFAFIPKIQAAFSKKNKKEEEKATGIDNAVAQIATQEESVDESDDLELVAVIAAAIAASEGAASTDGFVVRSIRKRR